MAMMEITEATFQELFGLVRNVDRKLTEVCSTLKEKEKRCERHAADVEDHEERIRELESKMVGKESADKMDERIKSLEDFKSSQLGTTGFVWRIIPILVSVGSVLIALKKL